MVVTGNAGARRIVVENLGYGHDSSYEFRRAFFDKLSHNYADFHGNAAENLARRVALLRSLIGEARVTRLVEIGCGTAMHLKALQPCFDNGIGVDFSRSMAQRARLATREDRKITVVRDEAERLQTIAPASVERVVCVGMLEHVPVKLPVFRAVHRILSPGGSFICLTVNGRYLWHRFWRGLGRPIHHLPTDRFLRRREIQRMCASAGFSRPELGVWSFVPSGDVAPALASLLWALDYLGAATGIAALRGGLWFRAVKP